jgi:hypothetical protein
MKYDEDQLDDSGDEQDDIVDNDSYVVDVVNMMMIMDYDQDQIDHDGVENDNDVGGLMMMMLMMMMLMLILLMTMRIEMIVDNYDEISIFLCG